MKKVKLSKHINENQEHIKLAFTETPYPSVVDILENIGALQLTEFEYLYPQRPKTTMIYTHVSTKEVGKVVSPFDKLGL